MEFEVAQRELCRAYVGGAPGVFVSGIVWLVAGLIWLRSGVGPAFAALFVGGMLIVPVSLLLERSVFGAPKVSPGNPLERLGLESSFVLFAGILIGYALLRTAPALAFPALAVTIGARYFAFRTLYGEPFYWLLGAVIALAGIVSALELLPMPGNLALAVGVIEGIFAALLVARWRHRGQA